MVGIVKTIDLPNVISDSLATLWRLTTDRTIDQFAQAFDTTNA